MVYFMIFLRFNVFFLYSSFFPSSMITYRSHSLHTTTVRYRYIYPNLYLLLIFLLVSFNLHISNFLLKKIHSFLTILIVIRNIFVSGTRADWEVSWLKVHRMTSYLQLVTLFTKGIQTLQHLWKKCVGRKGDCVEK